MASRGLNCLPFKVNEIDLPVQKRGCTRKTRRPYGALDIKRLMSNAPSKGIEQNEPRRNIFSWDDRGKRQNSHMDRGNYGPKT